MLAKLFAKIFNCTAKQFANDNKNVSSYYSCGLANLIRNIKKAELKKISVSFENSKVEKFEMKFAVGIVLVVFVSFGQSVILNCRFQIANRGGYGSFYECVTAANNTGNLRIIEEVRGTHLSGKSNADVESFYELGHTLTSFPANLASFFPKLKAIAFAGLNSKISSSDLKAFPNLIVFEIINANGTIKFPTIDGDLFQYTKKLQRITFAVSGVTSVGTNLLTGLNDLAVLYIQSRGGCIYFVANTKQEVLAWKEKLLLQCSSLETTSPRTTTTLSTSTSSQCPVRCSMNSEVDKLNSELNIQKANVEHHERIIGMLNERLLELEKKIR